MGWFVPSWLHYWWAPKSSRGAQEDYEVPVRLARAAVVSSAGRSSDDAGSPRRSSRVGKLPLTAYGDPRHSARSRLWPLCVLVRSALGRLPARSRSGNGRPERPSDQTQAKRSRQLLRRTARHRSRLVGFAAGGDDSRPLGRSRRLYIGLLL
ncbi:hypothetical protein NDU88_007384 [Pleurodeles waltl]|uniref:Uncharacterized protein n=1 Tax=Pleurodeles waltl TaxID=8319 RepID=A0AAV7RPC7_PLEWA|nr:hypothetical protein NDU88_007384 [Pleurodeles waltl]